MKKYMKEFRKNKVLILIVSILVLINILWFSLTRIKYYQFLKNIPKNEYGYNILNEDGYTYGVKKPDYMQFTGNLYVSKDNGVESIIIWPLLTGGFEYGVIIDDEKTNLSYQIYVDENMNPLEKDNLHFLKLLNENNSKINEIYSRAKNMWDLD